MQRVLLVAAALAVGAGGAWLLLRPKQGAAGGDLLSAFQRARAWYANEENQDYRRARQELLPFEEEQAGNPRYHLLLALIDLAELNHPVQDQDRLVPESPRHRQLLESALRNLQRADALSPGDDAIAYNLARVYIKLAPSAEDPKVLWRSAEGLLRRLADTKPADPATLMLYAGCREEDSDFAAAATIYQRISDLGKDFVPQTLYRVARYKLAQCLIRSGRREEGQEMLRKLDAEYPDRPRPAPGALEQGRFTRFVDPVEGPPSRPDPRGMNWRRVTARTGLPAAGSPRYFLAPDLDLDCCRDVVMQGESGLVLLRNLRNATFEDLTKEAGMPTGFELRAAAAGDLDNDGRMDLVVGGGAGVRVYLNITPEDEKRKWRFKPALDEKGANALGPRGEEPADCIVLWDLDHDGDLDLFCGGAKNRVYRTVVERPHEGDDYCLFEEVSEQVGMGSPPAREALLLDLEDDQDVDLVVGSKEGNVWFENLRQMQFRRHDAPAGEGIEAGDVDNDLLEELRIGGTVYEWRGGALGAAGARAALLDLDGDGILDADPFAGIGAPGRILSAVGSDLNRDGDQDLLLLTEAGLDLYLSQPARPASWLDVMPRGLKTNEAGIGTRIRLYAGDLRIGTTCRDGLVSFGLGRRTLIDGLLLRWTNGVEQGVVLPPLQSCLAVDEREGEVGSCPFVYAFDGERWHFVADIQSGTPLGLPYADRKYLPPRSNETILVPGALLRETGGLFRIDLTEEFRELFYVDQVVLRALDHPASVRPVLNEGFKVMRFPEYRVHPLDDLRPPLSARDGKGRDILDAVRARDGRHAVVFDPHPMQYEGLAREWSITLDFGDLSKADRVLLVMDGWVEFPTASASIAASRSKTVAFRPPVVEVVGADGSWTMGDADAGFPAGKGKNVLVDLTGKFATADGRVRITSTQRIHWDAFAVSTGPDRELRETVLPLRSAVHGFRGMSERVVGGEGPWRYDHDRLVAMSPWDQMPQGRLTRYGDVLELLRSIDDRYPVLASGDRIELAFDASGLPPLPEGWVRDFCITTEGWVKDADMNQAVRESVEPLPFHGMSGYPYAPPEAHPHPEFVREWFTRESRRLVDVAKPFAALGVPTAER